MSGTWTNKAEIHVYLCELMGGAFTEMNCSASSKYEVLVLPQSKCEDKLALGFVGNNGYSGWN